MRKTLEKAFWTALRSLEHNEHHLTIRVFGTPIYACARCLGGILGTFIALFILPPFMLLQTYDFTTIFILSWLLASFAIIDWSLIKVKISPGNNHIRFITGYLLNIGGMTYLLLLPVPFILRILTLLAYATVFLVIQYIVKCREHHLPLTNPIQKNLSLLGATTLPLTVGQTELCTHTGGISCGCCCPCGDISSCCLSPFCCCLGVIPAICIAKLIMDKGAKKHGK